MLILAACGCQTVKPETAGTNPKNITDASALQNPTSAKSDFHRDVSPEQAFNVHLELGRVYEAQGNFDAAVAEYQKSIEMGDKRGTALSGGKLSPAQRGVAQRRIASAFDRMGKFTQAEAHYRKALELAPKDAKVWNDVGYSYYVQGRLDDAERALKTAESLDPGNQRVMTNLGLTYAASGKPDKALEALSKAGGPAVGHANLGFILAALGRVDEARSHYEQALALQPELAPATQAIAQLDRQAQRASTTAVAYAAPVAPPAAVSPVIVAPSPLKVGELTPRTRDVTVKPVGILSQESARMLPSPATALPATTASQSQAGPKRKAPAGVPAPAPSAAVKPAAPKAVGPVSLPVLPPEIDHPTSGVAGPSAAASPKVESEPAVTPKSATTVASTLPWPRRPATPAAEPVTNVTLVSASRKTSSGKNPMPPTPW